MKRRWGCEVIRLIKDFQRSSEILIDPFPGSPFESSAMAQSLQESLHAARQLGLQNHHVYGQSAELFSATCASSKKSDDIHCDIHDI